MTGADYAMLGFLIAIFVVSGWFALSRRSDSPSTISPFRPLQQKSLLFAVHSEAAR
jgi:hypothetical protein